MTRQEILTAIKPYFDIEELVCDHTYAKWKEQAWQFLDTDYLHALLVIRRDILKKPMWCNSSTKHQRGLRCNRCQMVQEKSRPASTSRGTPTSFRATSGWRRRSAGCTSTSFPSTG